MAINYAETRQIAAKMIHDRLKGLGNPTISIDTFQDLLEYHVQLINLYYETNRLSSLYASSRNKERRNAYVSEVNRLGAIKIAVDKSINKIFEEIGKNVASASVTRAAAAAKLPRRKGGARRTRKHRGRKMRKTRHTRR